jgi:TRAP-type mannitol/chloroaromatic compound transport system permease small subunit
MQQRKNPSMFKSQYKLSWRICRVKKNVHVKGDFIYKGLLQNKQKLYIYSWITPMVGSIDIPIEIYVKH